MFHHFCLLSLSLARKTGFHPGTGLVGASDAAERQTPSFRPPWPSLMPPTPLDRNGRWGRCSGTAESRTSLLGICWIGFESPGRTVLNFCWSYTQGEKYMLSLGTSPPGWTRYRVWSASPFWVSTRTELCTSCTSSSPSWPAPTLHIKYYQPSLWGFPWRASIW